jgi:hypothetical protein
MSKHKKSQKKKMVRVSAGAKKNVKTRRVAGSVITANAPTSPILQANQDVKTAQANLAAASAKLDTQDGQVGALENELTTARATLANTVVDWDSFYDVFVTVARLYCKTAEDATSLGLAAVGLTIHALAVPLGVTVKWDPKTGLIRIHVHRAPGLRSVRLQISPDPVTAASWKDLPGDGATAALSGYAPGTWWVRAASAKAREVSDWTTPVSVIVKQ